MAKTPVSVEPSLPVDTSVAVDTLDRLAVMLTGVGEAAKQLREIGSFQSAIKALKQEHATWFEKVESVKADHGQAHEAHKTVLTESEQAKQQAEREAVDIRTKAQSEADAIVQRAKELADGAVQLAFGQHERELEALKTQIAKAKASIPAIEQRVTDTEAKAVEAEKRLKLAQANLERIRQDAHHMASGT